MLNSRDRRNRRQFEKAKSEAARSGGTVCGTVRADGTPVYFVVPEGASDDEVRAEAFKIREGRPMGKLERQLLDIARSVEG